MKKREPRGKPVILKKMAGFLFVYLTRNKSLCILIGYIFISLYFAGLTEGLYGLETSSNFYIIDSISFMQGGGPLSSANFVADFTTMGDIGFSGEVTSPKFGGLVGQVYLFLSPPEQLRWLISNLQAKTDILGPLIPEATWQKDNDPYFYWQIDVVPFELIGGFSISLDTLPDLTVDTTQTSYEFSPDSIPSGKHTFYVLPYTSGKAWEQRNLLSFEIWVDTEPPIISQLQPSTGFITTDNHIPISSLLYDAHSGIDKVATTLTLNNQTLLFDYDAQKQALTYKPDAPLSEGDNTVLLKAVDAVGNSVVNGWNFIVDTQPPTGSILINAGEAVTHSAYVSINIETQDSTTGIKNIYLSNDGVFDTELNQPLAYSPLISNWLLNAPDINGAKTVYVKFEDFAGNISGTYKDSIELELRTPDTRIISGPATVTESEDANFIYEDSKAGCLFSYKLDGLDWSDWQSSNKADFSGLTTANHYFYVKSGLDLNGDGKITIDEEDPTPAQWVWTIGPKGYLEKLRQRILFWRR